MGFFIYNETPYTGSPINVFAFKSETVARKYMEHYDNYMILCAMSKSPKSFDERAQVEKELKICRRKLAFWKKHPNYDDAIVKPQVERLNGLWRGRV